MANTIENLANSNYDIKQQLGDVPDVVQTVKRFSSSLTPKNHSTRLYNKDITTAFILNSPFYGVLGQNELGGSDIVTTLYAVQPNNNIFVERFYQDMYIDTTNSTGTLNSDESYTLQSGEVLQSEIIAKLRQPINRITALQFDEDLSESAMALGSLELGITLFEDGNIDLQISTDGGTTWVPYNDPSTPLTITGGTNDDELKYKITATETVTIDTPLIFKIN